jgi:hypothetical protein
VSNCNADPLCSAGDDKVPQYYQRIIERYLRSSRAGELSYSMAAPVLYTAAYPKLFGSRTGRRNSRRMNWAGGKSNSESY